MTLKPLLSKAVQEAFKLAVADVTMFEHMEAWEQENPPPTADGEAAMERWFQRRTAESEWYTLAIQYDVFQVDQQHWNGIDALALAQCLCVRLLGPGGWGVGPIYSANASVQQVVDATFARTRSSEIDDTAAQLSEAGFDVFDPTRDGDEDDPDA